LWKQPVHHNNHVRMTNQFSNEVKLLKGTSLVLKL